MDRLDIYITHQFHASWTSLMPQQSITYDILKWCQTRGLKSRQQVGKEFKK